MNRGAVATQSAAAPRFSHEKVLRSRTLFLREKVLSPCPMEKRLSEPRYTRAFAPLSRNRERIFFIRSAACLRVIRLRHSGQYLTLLELDAKNAPHSVHRFLSSVFISSAYRSLSAGSTATRNHLQSSE